MAVNSVHGNALAIVQDTIEWNGNTGKWLRSQFTIMSKREFGNDYQKISAPVTYWGDWYWRVVLDAQNQADRRFNCAAPLITDDARYLVLLASGSVFDSALRIYRRADSSDRSDDGSIKAVLVKEVKLDELWPPAKIEHDWTDHSPEWFAFGTFDFSEDNLRLIHKTRWGTTVRIDLWDGRVVKE